MAKYTVTRSCGHEETVALIGKMKDRNWRLENVEPLKLCHECYQIDLQRRREEANAEAAEAAKDNNLPALTGTDKQVSWAETIRIELLTHMDTIIVDRRLSAEDPTIMRDAIEHIKLSKITAHWWIDRRSLVLDPSGIINLLNVELDNIKHEYIMPPKEVISDALAESTVRTKVPKTETVAQIHFWDNLLEIKFPEKRDDFREIVKSELKMVWSEGSWKRRINFKNGTPSDRAAEAGHKLLHAGFPIRIFNAEIRDKAINADYEPEHTRWVTACIDGDYVGWFNIQWSRDEDLYTRAKVITGAKYSKPNIVVSPEHFADVLDFAEMYKFQISKGASEIIAKAENLRNNSIIANITAPKERDYAVINSKPSVLEIPLEVEIADEFKD